MSFDLVQRVHELRSLVLRLQLRISHSARSTVGPARTDVARATWPTSASPARDGAAGCSGDWSPESTRVLRSGRESPRDSTVSRVGEVPPASTLQLVPTRDKREGETGSAQIELSYTCTIASRAAETRQAKVLQGQASSGDRHRQRRMRAKKQTSSVAAATGSLSCSAKVLMHRPCT